MTPTRGMPSAVVVSTMLAVASAEESHRTIRWGVMGTGTIASDFVRVLKAVPGAEVAAIGSRTQERASEFAAALGVEDACCYGDYAALAADDTLDIVYVATPSARHVDDSIMCLTAGRAVLCEKSMASTADEAERVLQLARSKRRALSEGGSNPHLSHLQ